MGYRDFLAANHRCVLVTHKADGALQSSPVVCAVDDQGRVLLSVTQDRAKTRNVRRDPRVSLTVFTDAFFGPWVHLDGTAEVVDLPEAMDLLVGYYRQVAGEHPDWEEYRSAMVSEGRCVLRISVSHAAGPAA